MKQLFYFLCIGLVMQQTACRSPAKKQAQQTADAIQDAIKSYGPNQVATSEKGYYMKAVINGKPWTAKSMMEFNKINDHRVYGSDGETKIAFNLDLDHLHAGIERNFGEAFAADLLTHDEVGAWGGRKGKIIITKDEDNVMEGTFYFTATTHTDPDKSMEVTNGSFRILLK